MKQLSIILLMAVILIFATLTQAQDVSLQWDQGTDYGLQGYKVYYDTDGTGDFDGEGSPITITLAQDENSADDLVEFTLHDLPNTRTRFVVTAYDTGGLESGYSNQVNTGLTPPRNLLISAIDNIIAGLQDIKTYLAQKEK